MTCPKCDSLNVDSKILGDGYYEPSEIECWCLECKCHFGFYNGELEIYEEDVDEYEGG